LSKPLALVFAVVGIILLSAISLFISLRLPWMALLSSIAALLFIGYGFAVKAKIRKKQNRKS
jgi:FtsH-binding integral membrane protein